MGTVDTFIEAAEDSPMQTGFQLHSLFGLSICVSVFILCLSEALSKFVLERCYTVNKLLLS